MTLTVRQFPCLSDNYGFIIRDEVSGKTGCIDIAVFALIWKLRKTFGMKE